MARRSAVTSSFFLLVGLHRILVPFRLWKLWKPIAYRAVIQNKRLPTFKYTNSAGSRLGPPQTTRKRCDEIGLRDSYCKREDKLTTEIESIALASS